MKAEFFLPMAVDTEMHKGAARVTVKTTPDKWYGVTYSADKAQVVEAIRLMGEDGRYPTPLWQD
jgi:hypothetical protein